MSVHSLFPQCVNNSLYNQQRYYTTLISSQLFSIALHLPDSVLYSGHNDGWTSIESMRFCFSSLLVLVLLWEPWMSLYLSWRLDERVLLFSLWTFHFETGHKVLLPFQLIVLALCMWWSLGSVVTEIWLGFSWEST